MLVVQIHKVVPLAFDRTFFHTHQKLSLASECVSANSSSDEAAVLGCAVHRGVAQQDYVSPYILSLSKFHNLSSPDLTKCMFHFCP